MEEEKMIIEDNSGDRNYFTIIPNYIANHSTANDQALYFQMKKFAGEKGECFASEVLLRKKLGIGTKALKKSIQYLLEHNWIMENGFKDVPTKGGLQKIRVYKINDIWKLNNDFYKSKGVSPNDTPLPKGYAESTTLDTKGYAESNERVCQKESKGYAERATNKNHMNKNHIEEDTMSADADLSFEEFWKNYPKKELKKKSLEIWKRKKFSTQLQVIFDFIKKAKETDRWQKGYVKQPPAFLNGECWNDDLSSYNDRKQVQLQGLNLLKK